MSWCINQGPSYNLARPGTSYSQLSGFSQRFLYTQDDPRFTPGKKEVTLPASTMKGTFALKKGKKAKKQSRKSLVMPMPKQEEIYGGFANIVPDEGKRLRRRKNPRKKKRKRVKKK